MADWLERCGVVLCTVCCVVCGVCCVACMYEGEGRELEWVSEWLLYIFSHPP